MIDILFASVVVYLSYFAGIALPDVPPGDARPNTWSWSVLGAEKKAADWTAYCGVIASILLFTVTATY